LPTAPRIDLPRPALIAALGVFVLLATFLVTKAGDSVGTAAAPAPAPAKTAAAPKKTTTATAHAKPAKPAKPDKPAQPAVAAGAGLPRDVAHALNSEKVVVLFFYEPAAADDQATRTAVKAVQSAAPAAARGRVRLFQDKVARISHYRRVVGSLGISQSPAMVVIDRSRKAQLLQGYLDAGTIRQTVRDVL
jgi:hypothetical protein